MIEKMTSAKAQEIMDEGFHCSQVIMMHIAEKLGLDEEAAVKMTAYMGGGCFSGELCGTLNAAGQALSSVYGFGRTYSSEKNDELSAKVEALLNAFREKYGAVLCRDLLYKPTQAELDSGEQINYWIHCNDYCAYVCELLDQMLAE